MGRGGLPLFLLLSACTSREVTRHELPDRGWDLALLQPLDAEGEPVGTLLPFVEGGASLELVDEHAGFVVFGLVRSRLPALDGRPPSLDAPESIHLEPVTPTHAGSDVHFGFDEPRTHLLLELSAGSPYLELEGPVSLGPEGIALGFEGTHRLSLPHAQVCPSERRLVPLADTPFELSAPFFTRQIAPIDAEVLVLLGNARDLLRVRRGQAARDSDRLAVWNSTTTWTADLEHVFVAPQTPRVGFVSLYVAAQDRYESQDGLVSRELEGLLFHVLLPLQGAVSEAVVEALTLPVDPELGYVPRLRGVAVAQDGTVVAVGGWEDPALPPYGYYAVRPAGEQSFRRFELPLEGDPKGARGRAIAVLDRPGAPSVFTVGTSVGELASFTFEGVELREIPQRFVVTKEESRRNMEWRRVWSGARPEGFEVWGSARDGILARRRVDGTWSVAGDVIREERLSDPQISACDGFGELAAVEAQDLEVIGDEVFLALRDCDALVRLVLDARREPVCAGAVRLEGAGDHAQRVSSGFYSVTRWGEALVAAGGLGPGLYGLAAPP